MTHLKRKSLNDADQPPDGRLSSEVLEVALMDITKATLRQAFSKVLDTGMFTNAAESEKIIK